MRILITGGDHTGKDSLARALIDQMPELIYDRSSSLHFATLVPAWQDGRNITDWWLQRRDNRQEWIDEFDKMRKTYRPGIFATSLYDSGANIVTGLRFTSELIDLLTSEQHRPDLVLWCRYATRMTETPDTLTLDLAAQLTSIAGVPLMVVWSEVMAPSIIKILRGLDLLLEDDDNEPE